uniref:S.cerevisiae (S288C) HSP26, SEC18, UBC4, tRNA-Arg and tRNA-Asp genes n=1 Tax=Saccharomyces cerevisiae TaxID=4932 RepID=E9PA42_YEASX|nr:unnamed protein product [Saccharomyces cerevisiae]
MSSHIQSFSSRTSNFLFLI